MTETKTSKEIEDLKEAWRMDPCWDLEDTDGFEAHKEELLKYRLKKEEEWEFSYQKSLSEKAQKYGCEDNRKLAEYIWRMENEMEKLEERIYQLENK